MAEQAGEKTEGQSLNGLVEHIRILVLITAIAEGSSVLLVLLHWDQPGCRRSDVPSEKIPLVVERRWIAAGPHFTRNSSKGY